MSCAVCVIYIRVIQQFHILSEKCKKCGGGSGGDRMKWMGSFEVRKMHRIKSQCVMCADISYLLEITESIDVQKLKISMAFLIALDLQHVQM